MPTPPGGARKSRNGNGLVDALVGRSGWSHEPGLHQGHVALPLHRLPVTMGSMRTLLNIIWFIFSGLWLWLAYMLAGVICCVLIVTIPWGIASFRLANYAAWPFGRDIVERPNSGIGALLGNIIWLLVAGWWIALTHIATAIALCVTIIGIPMAWANLKLIPVALMPLGKQIINRP